MNLVELKKELRELLRDSEQNEKKSYRFSEFLLERMILRSANEIIATLGINQHALKTSGEEIICESEILKVNEVSFNGEVSNERVFEILDNQILKPLKRGDLCVNVSLAIKEAAAVSELSDFLEWFIICDVLSKIYACEVNSENLQRVNFFKEQVKGLKSANLAFMQNVKFGFSTEVRDVKF